MTLSVALKLREMGYDPFYISLCEMRRMRTPTDKLNEHGLEFFSQAAISEELKPSTGAKTLGSNQSPLRNLLRSIFWALKIKPFVARAIKSADRILLMNDTAYPGDKIASLLNQKEIPFYLLQEGIRFPLPGEGKSSYGSNGATKLFTWGDRSAKYFASVIQTKTQVEITGSPRFDSFIKEISGLSKDPDSKTLGVFTNPIDDQGFCTKAEKLSLFERFVDKAAPYLKEHGISLGVKCHPREDLSEYLNLANKHIDVRALDKDIKKAISQVDAGIIMASTVGLELLGAGKPIGQLEIPEYGWVFDYTDSASTLKIPVEGKFDMSVLFEIDVDKDYFNSQISLGQSVELIASHLVN